MPMTAAAAKRPERLQDARKGDRSGSDRGFRLKTNAEISVITSPIGKGSMNVSAALKSGFLYSSLYFLTCSSFAWMAAGFAPEAVSFSTKCAPYASQKPGMKL